MRPIVRLLLPLVLLSLFALPAPAAHADVKLGYLWSLLLDFESGFDGVLTVEVGPWENGDLLSVDKTSTARVRCTPVGAVALNAGDAVFSGGHIECQLDLAAVLLRNHGLVIDQLDSYGSIVLYTDLETTALNIAPIVSHPDADYRIDFSSTSSVTLAQTLVNNAGPQMALLDGVVGVSRVKYGFEYGCVWAGPCHSTFRAGAQTALSPLGGGRVRFRTTPTTLRIGGDGVTTFMGRMGNLIIDPGNSVQ